MFTNTITMRKIILGVAVSLDGFIEGPKGEYDWCFTDQDYGMSAFFKRVDCLFMGRKSYELVSSMDQGKGKNPYPKMKLYVFSNTLKEADKKITVICGDIKARIEEIKNQPGKDIWLFGGASLTSSLLNLGLIDEFWLAVHPVVLGAGKPLFSEVKNRINLKLADTKTYSSGLVALTYYQNEK